MKLASVSTLGTQEHMDHVLKREKDAVPLRVGLLLNADFAVDHGHDAIAKLLVNKGLDRGTVDEHTLRRQSQISHVGGAECAPTS